MKKRVLLIVVLMSLLAGCTNLPGQTPTGMNYLGYKINALDLTVSKGSILHFDFTLENRRDQDTKGVRCWLDNAPGFSVETIRCNSVEGSESQCVFGDMMSGEIVGMDMTLRAPRAEQTTLVSILCEYRTKGQSSLNFRVYDFNSDSPSGKVEEGFTGGPLQVVPNVNLATKEIRDGKEVSVDSWARENKDFTLEVTFQDMGDSKRESMRSGDFNDFAISLENIRKNDRVQDCNFTYSDGKLRLPANKEISFGQPLTCELTTAEVPSGDWVLGQIIVDYDYVYKFKIEEEIEVV